MDELVSKQRFSIHLDLVRTILHCIPKALSRITPTEGAGWNPKAQSRYVPPIAIVRSQLYAFPHIQIYQHHGFYLSANYPLSFYYHLWLLHANHVEIRIELAWIYECHDDSRFCSLLTTSEREDNKIDSTLLSAQFSAFGLRNLFTRYLSEIP